MKLSIENFFSHLIFYPFEADTKKSKTVALVASIACGIFSIGICHLACRIKLHFSPKSASTEKVSRVKDLNLLKKDSNSNFFKTITSKNIDTLLDVNEDGWIKNIQNNHFSIKRAVSEEFKIDKRVIVPGGVVSYLFVLQFSETHWIHTSVSVIKDHFVCLQNGTRDKYHQFENFDQLLQSLFQGNFAQANVHYYLLRKKDNTLIRYNNPLIKP